MKNPISKLAFKCNLYHYIVDDLGFDPNMDFLFTENGFEGAWRGGRDDASFPLFHATQYGNYLTVMAGMYKCVLFYYKSCLLPGVYMETDVQVE